jgi:hypothetical protein
MDQARPSSRIPDWWEGILSSVGDFGKYEEIVEVPNDKLNYDHLKLIPKWKMF